MNYIGNTSSESKSGREMMVSPNMAIKVVIAIIFCIAVTALVLGILGFNKSKFTDVSLTTLRGTSGNPINVTEALVYVGDDSQPNQLGSTNFTGPVQLTGNPLSYVLASSSLQMVASSSTSETDVFSGTMTLPTTFSTSGMVVIHVQGRLGPVPSAGNKTVTLVIGDNAPMTVMSTTSSVANQQFHISITIGAYMVNTALKLYATSTTNLGGTQTINDAPGLDSWSVGQTIAVNLGSTTTNGDIICYTAVAISYPSNTTS